MAKLIIIRGPSAVGKSTVAKAVAEKMGCKTAHVSVDLTEQELMFEWNKIQVKDRLKFMYMNAYSLIENYISSGYNVVTDGYYSIENNKSMLKYIIELGKKFHSEIYVFELEADIKEIITRTKKRGYKEDIINDFRLIKKRHKKFDIARMKGAMVIDTNKQTTAKVVDTILEVTKIGKNQ